MAIKAVIRRIPPAEVLDISGSSVFLRDGQQIIGTGKAISFEATGPNRIYELSKMWQELIRTAEIDNQSGLANTGLIALTSITFSESSAAPSLLYVPAVTRVYREGVAFEVVVDAESSGQPRLSPEGTFSEGVVSAEDFKTAVAAGIRAINSTQLEKVVLGRDLVMPIKAAPDLSRALTRLHEKYPKCWTYQIGNVFGASPELLLRADTGEVSARVLAGTAGRGTDPDVDRAIADGLAHSQKNRHEHDYAVNSMVKALEPFCEVVEADSEPFSLALPDLWHLATDVTGRLRNNVSLLDVIEKLHPTAAVAGTPTVMAEQLISQLEPFDRAGYAGPVGWLSSDGAGEVAIALRGGIIEKDQIRAIAGCGIVAESDPEAELAETELKFKAVRYAFSESN